MVVGLPIVIELSGEPQGKARPRFRNVTTRAGRQFTTTYTPAQTRKYEDVLRYAAQQAMGNRPPLDGALTVTVDAFFPIPTSWSNKQRERALTGILWPTKKPDWDNLAKILDSFNEVVWRDDCQVVNGTVRKAYSQRPRLRVTVQPVNVVQASIAAKVGDLFNGTPAHG